MYCLEETDLEVSSYQGSHYKFIEWGLWPCNVVDYYFLKDENEVPDYCERDQRKQEDYIGSYQV